MSGSRDEVVGWAAHVMLSIKVALISLVRAEGWESFSLKTDSRTASSVEVVSWPVKAHQSFTTIPVEKRELLRKY